MQVQQDTATKRSTQKPANIMKAIGPLPSRQRTSTSSPRRRIIAAVCSRQRSRAQHHLLPSQNFWSLIVATSCTVSWCPIAVSVLDPGHLFKLRDAGLKTEMQDKSR